MRENRLSVWLTSSPTPEKSCRGCKRKHRLAARWIRTMLVKLQEMSSEIVSESGGARVLSGRELLQEERSASCDDCRFRFSCSVFDHSRDSSSASAMQVLDTTG